MGKGMRKRREREREREGTRAAMAVARRGTERVLQVRLCGDEILRFKTDERRVVVVLEEDGECYCSTYVLNPKL